MASTGSSSVQVTVRLRPINDKEKKHGTLPVVTASTGDKTVTVIKGKGARQVRQQFSFDNVFTSFSTQEEVFDETLKPVISDVFKGYESTVFAYGQTGTGKTHTMEGDLTDPSNYGVIPRASQAIFDNLRSPQYSKYDVTCSYLEIYNEDLGDLLSDGNNKVTMMEGKGGVVCRGLSEVSVSSSADVLSLMTRAQQKRHIGETKMNKQSSRSHCIFTIKVAAAVECPDGTFTLEGKLHMVDLAGSECAKSAGMEKTTGNQAARERERMSINRSLLTLGRVISILKEQSQSKKPSKNVRIPYRDSKLTRILQESLGGRCKTVIIATLSPSITAIEESISTLNYAQSANGIINKPVSTSSMAAGGGSFSGSATPSKKGAITTESWQEMECRLQYMQTQVEEAQAALGRKHMQQQELQERADRLSNEVRDREVKIGLMEKEMNTLKTKADSEVEKRRSAEAKLRESQFALKKTTAILVATQHTESNLTSEATALLQTLKEAVADGDVLHNIIFECKDLETKRQAATKDFREATMGVLEDSIESLGNLAREVESHAEALMKSAAQGYEQQTVSLASTQSLIREIADSVKSVTSTVSKQLLDDGGIVPLLGEMNSSIESGTNVALAAISAGDSALSETCTTSRQKFIEHGRSIQEMEKAYTTASSKSISALETNVHANKSKIEGMVESASRALQDAKSVRAERMTALSELISSWKKASLESSNGINDTAAAQSSVLKELLSSMEKEMARHDTTSTILSEQNTFIDASEVAQIDNLSSQSSLLISQQEIIAKARKEQSEMRSEIMRTIMGGVQELVNQQMARLANANDTHLTEMSSSNQSVVDSNTSMAKSTEDVSERLRAANSSLIFESQKIRENDVHAKKVVKETNGIFGGIAEMASKSVSATTSYSNQANASVTEMHKLDKESEKILKGIKADGQKCAKHIETTIQKQTKKDLMGLASTSKEISTYASNSILADATASVGAVEESLKGPMKIFNENMSQVVESSKMGAQKIEAVSQMQVNAAKSLCSTVEEKQAHFSTEIAEQQESNMKTQKSNVMEMATTYSTTAKDQASSVEAQSRDVTDRITTYSSFADKDIKPAPKRQSHAYSTSLSATPAECEILRDANIELEEHHSDDESTKSEPRNNEDDECSSQVSQDNSQLTEETMNNSIETESSLERSMESEGSASSPPPRLKEVAVNRNGSNSSVGSAGNSKQSSIPRPTNSAGGSGMKRAKSNITRSRGASSPAISRKRVKTSRHGSGTPVAGTPSGLGTPRKRTSRARK